MAVRGGDWSTGHGPAARVCCILVVSGGHGKWCGCPTFSSNSWRFRSSECTAARRALVGKMSRWGSKPLPSLGYPAMAALPLRRGPKRISANHLHAHRGTTNTGNDLGEMHPMHTTYPI